MFNPKTIKIKNISKNNEQVIKDLESVFQGKTNVYIDYANVLGWENRLGWSIDIKRLKQFLDSFNTINSANFYYGSLAGDVRSKNLIKDIQGNGYNLKTKPVKIMRISLDVSSIPSNSPTILQNFISKSLLRKFNIETIEYLNSKIRELNNQGTKYIEVRKCNFDVEIGRDILVDSSQNEIASFVIWSGDSDFSDPVIQLFKERKNITIFATARRISRELSQTGARIFDIQKIRKFICWPRDAKRTP
ncbi:MAG: NYN domain-containing protein [Candidatus Daviesbacteria bacterium]|nr:NYN domain-containing protein [Candidatus Daviesbacteria bacterium]